MSSGAEDDDDLVTVRPILVVRGLPVALAANVASVFGVETREVNQAVRRNPDKFGPSQVPSRRWLELGWRSLRVAQPKRFRRWSAGMETTPWRGIP